MRTTGLIRQVDSLGRIVLPSDVRRRLGLEPGQSVEITLDGEQVILRRFAPTCIFCGSADGLLCYQGKNVCSRCIRNLQSV